MKIKIIPTFLIWMLVFSSGTKAQTTIVDGDIKSRIFFNENEYSLGTSLDGYVGNTEILSRTGDVYLSTNDFRTNSLIVKNETGNVGIGTITPQAKLDVIGNIFASGKVAIGTADSARIGDYALAVNGDAIFNKAIVKLYTNWPDYVFFKNYELIPLKDLESFILLNNHLPGVPGAIDVQKNGIDLGDNQAILLKKVEELTLYIIEQDKKAVQRQQQFDNMQLQLDELKALLIKQK